MHEKIKNIKEQINKFEANDEYQLEKFRLQYISNKSQITLLFSQFKDIQNDQKKELGQQLNELKILAKSKFKFLVNNLDKNLNKEKKESIDLTLPPQINIGSEHPLSKTRNKIVEIFKKIGFSLSDGPEIEDDWHNFSALNVPQNHPAREMQDTFFIDKDHVLRTQTSSVQIRVMQKEKPPIRTIAMGRVFRNEAISARAHCIFHQVEGLYINKNVSFKDLKQTVYYFVKELFDKNTKVRFRPSYFPFTEPSAEVDISCRICEGKGCKVCKHTGWVEIGGAGLVDPNVLKNCNIDSVEYSGFAFGMGIERITMLVHKINDLRFFTENNIKFLNQFTSI